MTAITLLVVIASGIVILGAVYMALLQIGLQEADDPEESHPEDLTEYEKRHVHRSDVHVQT